MRNFFSVLALAPTIAFASLHNSHLANANEFPYEPIILEGGNILLIDKGSGWNWILEAGTGDPHERRSWKQLPLPGHPGNPRHPGAPGIPGQPGRSENQRQAMPAPPPIYWEPQMQPPGPHAPGMRGQMARPQMIPANPEFGPRVTPPVWQSPPLTHGPANSHLQAVPRAEAGEALEARPDEPRKDVDSVRRDTQSDSQSRQPQGQPAHGEKRPAPESRLRDEGKDNSQADAKKEKQRAPKSDASKDSKISSGPTSAPKKPDRPKK